MTGDYLPVSLQRRVRQRARDRCEYCRLSQAMQEATFHIDHVVPRSGGGSSEFSNLALACVSCSLRKAARVQGVDPLTNEIAAIFHPRAARWEEHFEVLASCEIGGRTPTGRATVALLQLNRPIALAIRDEERLRSRWP